MRRSWVLALIAVAIVVLVVDAVRSGTRMASPHTLFVLFGLLGAWRAWQSGRGDPQPHR